MFLWYNDDDTWYNFSDWVVAESPDECNRIQAEKENVPLEMILKRGYTWWSYRAASGDARHLGYSKEPPDCPIPGDEEWAESGF